jgi:hypothetical protein
VTDATLTSHTAIGDAMQLVMNKWNQLLERGVVAACVRSKEFREVVSV